MPIGRILGTATVHEGRLQAPYRFFPFSLIIVIFSRTASQQVSPGRDPKIHHTEPLVVHSPCPVTLSDPCPECLRPRHFARKARNPQPESARAVPEHVG